MIGDRTPREGGERERRRGKGVTANSDGKMALSHILAGERLQAGLPVGQQLLQLTNYSQTECYSNAAIAVLLGNPIFTSFMSAINCDSELVTAVCGLTGCRPNAVLSGRNIRSKLVLAVPGAAQFGNYTLEEDCHEYLTWLLDGLQREMPINFHNQFVSLFR